MPIIHCMSGYIGFGKTTIAKQLAEQYHAICITPDEVMKELYGTDVGSDFIGKAEKLNEHIWKEIEKSIQTGQDVIYDTGPWGVKDRKYIMDRATHLNATVIWHQVQCSMETARKRTLARSLNPEELSVDEHFFDENLKRYTPITPVEHLQVIYHKGE